MSGCTIVLKPSPFTPLTTLRVAELIADKVPAGTVNIITGEDALGPMITSHPDIDKITFTGSTATGKKIMAGASGDLKRITLELGGNDASIVLPDADVEKVAEQLFWSSFSNAGQVCIAGQKAIEFVGISLDRCRDTLDHLLTFFLRGFLPFFKRSSRGSDCTVQFILATGWYAPDHLLVGRVQNLQPLAIVDHFAVDQVLIVCHRFSLLAGIPEFSLRNILSGFVA